MHVKSGVFTTFCWQSVVETIAEGFGKISILLTWKSILLVYTAVSVTCGPIYSVLMQSWAVTFVLVVMQQEEKLLLTVWSCSTAVYYQYVCAEEMDCSPKSVFFENLTYNFFFLIYLLGNVI